VILECGQDIPSTGTVATDLTTVKAMEEVGFDGVVVRCTYNPHAHSNLGYLLWRDDITGETAQALADLIDANAAATTLTHNFPIIYTSPDEHWSDGSDCDWFNDAAWAKICVNAGLMAALAFGGGCEGLMLDTESYGAISPWTYGGTYAMPASWSGAVSFADMKTKVKARGGEFMTAINAEFAGITLLSAHGPSIANGTLSATGTPNNLMMSFFDGMLAAADANTTIVDLCEMRGFGATTLAEYTAARVAVLTTAQALSSEGAEYTAHMRCGQTVWMDCRETSHSWSTVDYTLNYYRPKTFQQVLTWAMQSSDKYVWVYTASPVDWWTAGNVPAMYGLALKQAKFG
jgi:hypothetical protein